MNRSETCDVVVVGGGIAGLSAAARAAEQGLAVVLLERGSDERYLCNTRWSGGVLHVAFHGVREAPDVLVAAVMEATNGSADPELARALAEHCGRAVDWLQRQGAKLVRFGNASWQQWVMAPPRPILAGLAWKGMGPDFTLRTLAARVEQYRGRILRGSAAIELLERDGACIGVRARDGGGLIDFHARAVVLADGGFQGNVELLREHVTAMPESLFQRGPSTGVGDGLRMARALDAQLTDLSYFYGHLLARDSFHNERVWPYPQLDELGSGGIVVDGSGHRVADESHGGIYLANAIAKLPDPLDTWAIFDERVWQGPGRSARIPANPHLINAGGTIHVAQTLDELARRAGLDARLLVATVATYNEAVHAGRSAQLQPPRSTAKMAPAAIEHPPYYAVPLCAGITYTFGGIAIDGHARVLREASNAPIRGLYAAGATTGGLEGGTPGAYTGGLLRGLVFGLRAAEHIASK